MTRVAFINNICPHYRVKTYELLARHYDVTYYFFSDGHEWYWQQAHGVHRGDFKHEYLSGFRVGRTRIVPGLVSKLLLGDFDVVVKCLNGRFALPVTYLISRLRRKPFILFTEVWMTLQSPFHRLFFPVTRHIYTHADAIVGAGEHVKRYLVSVGARPERVFAAPYAVDNERYCYPVPVEQQTALRQELQVRPDEKIVLYLGRLEESKGLSYLVEAFASQPQRDSVLVIAGDGTEMPHLKRLVAEKGITDRVRLPGYIPVDRAVLYHSIAWVYVLPSITLPMTKEPWGLVANEAFNQGVPVIATDAVGAAAGGLVRDGENGFVVPERNSQALAVALGRILGDPALRERMSQNARQLIATWDNRQMVDGFHRAIEYSLTHRGK